MEPPPEKDPYRAVWQMSQVGDAGKHSGRRVRWLAGTIAGLVCLMPFALVTSVFWGFWGGDVELNGPGWATLLIGVGAALTVGGYVATTDN
ncbi:hypothetical protein [Actinophytocola oryzae]|uniref:Uncharacterized protein n=1 Tax=Actinophytocola oryzae TaxID=502181 RepID=A0A4R7VDR0_9PSEU|nr:hypothetical protein [Actinophytocola oryzae]TDV47129.1 hypothetical protein CLV71_110313 [Actinophytocola oryzae]